MQTSISLNQPPLYSIIMSGIDLLVVICFLINKILQSIFQYVNEQRIIYTKNSTSIYK